LIKAATRPVGRRCLLEDMEAVMAELKAKTRDKLPAKDFA
jgi:hypothetical protein